MSETLLGTGYKAVPAVVLFPFGWGTLSLLKPVNCNVYESDENSGERWVRSAELDVQGRPHWEADISAKTWRVEGMNSAATWGKSMSGENDHFKGPELLVELWGGQFGWKKWRWGRTTGNKDREVMGTRCCRPCRTCILNRVGIYWRISNRWGLWSTLCSKGLLFIPVLWMAWQSWGGWEAGWTVKRLL